MKISETMDLSQLAERMGDTATESEAYKMRDLLVQYSEESIDRDEESLDTQDIPEDHWLDMLTEACSST